MCGKVQRRELGWGLPDLLSKTLSCRLCCQGLSNTGGLVAVSSEQGNGGCSVAGCWAASLCSTLWCLHEPGRSLAQTRVSGLYSHHREKLHWPLPRVGTFPCSLSSCKGQALMFPPTILAMSWLALGH